MLNPTLRELCPGGVWKAKEGCPEKRRIRSKPFTFIPLMGRRVGKQLCQAGVQRFHQDLNAPHFHTGASQAPRWE